MWLAPSVMFIEMAQDSLHNADPRMLASQEAELKSFGDVRAQEIGAKGISSDLRIGYMLGLQTARMILASSPALILKGVKPEDVL
jgi:hypothetical protein